MNGYIEDFNQIRTQQILEGNYEKKVNQPTTTTRKKSIRKKKKKLIIVIIREEKQIALYLIPICSVEAKEI